MTLNTASEVISFAKNLEEGGRKLYEDLAQRYIEGRETFLSFAKENAKNIVRIERVYYEVISDALEACFSFNINSNEYMYETELAENARYPDALKQLVEMEEITIKFYSDAAEHSKSLLADVPRIFELIAKKRDNRRLELRLLLNKED